MASIGRPRQYVSAVRLYAMFPLLRFSYERGAYVLRFVGESRGPVLRKDRRRGKREYNGPDRREGGVDLLASRPVGSVRRIEVADPPRASASSTEAIPPRRPATPGRPETSARRTDATPANRRRRQHGRRPR